MAVAGRKPVEDRSQVVHRNKPEPGTEWVNVPNIPHDGPPLPERTQALSTDDPLYDRRAELGLERTWPAWTVRWWEAIRRMPHAARWSETEWEAAYAVAESHARFVEGWKGCTTGSELRIKEKALGTTADALRDLRIRYVDPPKPATGPLPDNVRPINVFQEL